LPANAFLEAATEKLLAGDGLGSGGANEFKDLFLDPFVSFIVTVSPYPTDKKRAGFGALVLH
jgi:hypothetical protein